LAGLNFGEQVTGHLGTQRRAKAGRFVKAIRSLKSSVYEDFIHRDLLLACSVLADGTPVGPADIVEALLSEILSVWESTSLISLRADIEKVFGKLKGTEYAEVLARLAIERSMSPYRIVALAEKVGPDFLIDSLLSALNSLEASLALSAADLLIVRRKAEAVNAAVRFATDVDRSVKTWAVSFLLNAGDPRGIPLLLDLLKSSDPVSLATLGSRITERNDRVLEAVSEQLQSGDSTIQLNATQLLAYWKDPRGVEALVQMVASSGDGSARILLGDVDEFENETLLQFLDTPDELVRSLVVSELASRGVPRGIDAFFKSRAQAPDFYGERVLGLLGRRKNPKALAVLREQLTSSDQRARVHSASVLAKVGERAGVDTLIGLLNSDDERTKLAAIDGLLGVSNVPLLDHIVPLLSSPNVGVHLEATSVLGKLKEPGAARVLGSLLDDGRPSVKRTAAELAISRDEPEIVKAMGKHVEGFLKDKTEIADSLGISAYQFLKRHLTPASGIHPSVRIN